LKSYLLDTICCEIASKWGCERICMTS
jgi:hypothetical protein